jgi:hypothetical protein
VQLLLNYDFRTAIQDDELRFAPHILRPGAKAAFQPTKGLIKPLYPGAHFVPYSKRAARQISRSRA